MKEQQKSEQKSVLVIIKMMSQGIEQPAANCNEAERTEEDPEQDEEEQLEAEPAGGGEDQHQFRGEPGREEQRAQQRAGERAQQRVGGGGKGDKRLGRGQSFHHLLSTQVYHL